MISSSSSLLWVENSLNASPKRPHAGSLALSVGVLRGGEASVEAV